jgi:hypothetical protein
MNARTAQWLYYGLLVVELSWNVPRGSRAAVLSLMMMFIVLRYYGLRKRPSLPGFTALALVGVLGVFPFLYEYRNSGARGTTYHQDFRGNLDATATTVLDQSPDEAWNAGVKATLGRFAGTQMVASMLHQGPDAIGRDPGETLSWTLTGLLPRAVFPNKPDPGGFAHEFGASLAVTAPGDTRTSVTVTPIAELYFNYRLTGIILGMFVLGAVYRVIGDYFAGRHKEAASLAVYAASAWPLINAQEAIIAGGLIGIIKGMAVFALALAACLGLQQVAERRAVGRS